MAQQGGGMRVVMIRHLVVAQLGRVLALEARGRRFESCLPDFAGFHRQPTPGGVEWCGTPGETGLHAALVQMEKHLLRLRARVRIPYAVLARHTSPGLVPFCTMRWRGCHKSRSGIEVASPGASHGTRQPLRRHTELDKLVKSPASEAGVLWVRSLDSVPCSRPRLTDKGQLAVSPQRRESCREPADQAGWSRGLVRLFA